MVSVDMQDIFHVSGTRQSPVRNLVPTIKKIIRALRSRMFVRESYLREFLCIMCPKPVLNNIKYPRKFSPRILPNSRKFLTRKISAMWYAKLIINKRMRTCHRGQRTWRRYKIKWIHWCFVSRAQLSKYRQLIQWWFAVTRGSFNPDFVEQTTLIGKDEGQIRG